MAKGRESMLLRIPLSGPKVGLARNLAPLPKSPLFDPLFSLLIFVILLVIQAKV